MQLPARNDGLLLCSELTAEQLLSLELIWRHDTGDGYYLLPVHRQEVLLHVQAAMVSHNWVANCTDTPGMLDPAAVATEIAPMLAG